MKLMPSVLALVASLAAGCADTVHGSAPPPPDAASPDAASPDVPSVDVPSDAPRDAGSCALPDGRRCPVGMSCPAGDDCNVCSCPADGAAVLCTLRDCPPDAGARRCTAGDACAPGAFCHFPEAGCASEGVCEALVPCAETQTYCACDGATYTSCAANRPTARAGACAVADAGGPRACRTAADCGRDGECQFRAPGCDVAGTCGVPRDCAAIVPYCGCDGRSFLDCPGGLATRPYRAEGACPAGDGGAPDRCAGAHIGRGGRYCAGPADEPLPDDCCTWNCDLRTATCESLPPRCPDGLTNTVSDVSCWGPCVPPSACAPLLCAPDNTCPPGWRCDPSTGRCSWSR